MAKIGVYIDNRKLYIAAMVENEAQLLPCEWGDAHPADLCTGGERASFFAEDMDAFGFQTVFSYVSDVVNTQLEQPIEDMVLALPAYQAYRFRNELVSASGMSGIYMSRVITACDALAVASAYHRLLKCFSNLDHMNERFDAAQQAQHMAIQVRNPHAANAGHYVGMADLHKKDEQDIAIAPNAMPQFWPDEISFLVVSSQNAGIPAIRKLCRDFPGNVELCPEGTEALGALYMANHEIFSYIPDIFYEGSNPFAAEE